jgi:rhodanese-related sulfurtransferase
LELGVSDWSGSAGSLVLGCWSLELFPPNPPHVSISINTFDFCRNASWCNLLTMNVSFHSPMREVLEVFPGAQRALFRRYHIGGCSSCGFSPDETLAQVCARNGNLDVAEVLAHIQSSHEQDAKVLISPKELAEFLQHDQSVKLVDVRSREEFQAVHIEGAVLLSQDVMRELMASGSNTNPIVVIDHAGKNGLDAAAYFMGHGLQNVRCLRGGIDAWAQEIDPKIRRYKLG